MELCVGKAYAPIGALMKILGCYFRVFASFFER